METFSVSPEDCLILKAFKEAKSLRDAAHKLGMDPAGLTRKVQQISNHYGFLQKVNNRWIVTARGLDLVAWVESCIQSQKKILYYKSGLRLASTMWLSEEILVPHLPKLKQMTRENLNISMTVPDQSYELSLIDGSVDFAIICHPPENPEIEHRMIYPEEWIIIAPKTWKAFMNSYKSDVLKALKTKPFIRHSELNTDLFLPGMDGLLESEIQMDNLISIRSAVVEDLGWSLVPRMAVHRHLENRQLLEVPYEIQVRDRKVCLWWLRNRYESKRQSAMLISWLKVCLSDALEKRRSAKL